MAPIILIGFNRPKLIKTQLEILSKLDVDNLFISIDGPRNQEDLVKINEIKIIIESFKSNFNNLSVNFNKINLGCKMAIETALDRFFSQNEFGIIIEDDCVPNKSFLDFCNLYLSNFQDSSNIGSVTGSKFGVELNENPFLSNISYIWGWATWSKNWIDYRKNYQRVFSRSNVFSIKKFNFLTKRRFRNNALRSLNNKIDTWDYSWIYYCMLMNHYCVVPSHNLIQNVGFGPDSTHTAEYRPELSPKSQNIKQKLKIDLKYNKSYDKFLVNDILRFKFNIYDKIKKSFS